MKKEEMTDQYFSRMLAIARQNKNIKFIKNIENDQIEVELNDGSAEWLPWDKVMNNLHHNIALDNEI